MLQFIITMSATVIFDLSIAILIGVGLGLIFFIINSTAIDISVDDIDLTRIEREDKKKPGDWAVIYITGPLFFMTSDAVKENLARLEGKEVIFFSLRGVAYDGHYDLGRIGGVLQSGEGAQLPGCLLLRAAKGHADVPKGRDCNCRGGGCLFLLRRPRAQRIA